MAKRHQAVSGGGAGTATATAQALAAEAPVIRTCADSVAESEIAELAYSYWEARGSQGGSPEEDWFRAVEELRRKASAA